MVIDTAPMLKHAGEPIRFHFEEVWRPLDTGREPISLVTPVTFTGESRAQEDVFIVEGTLSVRYQALCARCMKPVEAGLQIDVLEEFSRTASEENPDRYLFQGTAIDLTQLVEDSILLHLPMRHLCDVNCKGLCPVCGADRNVTQCSCGAAEGAEDVDDDVQHPFAVLKTLLRDNEEEV